MKFGVDTYSWTKLFLLVETNWKELIVELVSNINLFITPEVRKELVHFHSQYENIWGTISVFKKREKSIDEFDSSIFDEADISLLESLSEQDVVIITEDRPMLATNVTRKNNIISLVDFFALLYRRNTITHQELYNLAKWLEKKKNITKKKKKMINQILN